MEEHIPIDIHIPKLLEWLISRRHCKNVWPSQISEIREKINSALQDMPEHEAIAELLSGSYINYFHCCQITEILKETEADTKNLFGMYGSKRMKDWQEIVRLYQKDNAYLAETANILLRNVKYEIPSIKKQIAKFKQLQQECDKKEVEYRKSVSSVERELETMKKQLGVNNNNPRLELLKRTAHLNEVYDNVVLSAKALEKPIQYYRVFSQQVVGVPYTLPIISYIIEKGNTTTYEWLYGEPPQHIETQDVDLLEQSANDNVADDIDWDITTPEETDYDYGITLEESGIEVEVGEKEISVAKGNEANSVLDNPSTRNEFFAQLLELQYFLKMRLLETQKENDGLFTLTQDIQESSESILKMLDAVQVIKQLLTDSVNQQLHLIKHSKRYVDKMTAVFNQKTAAIEKMMASQTAVKERKEEMIQNEADLRPKLALLIEKTKQLQELIESEISKKYKNRPVHLVGGF